MPCAASVSSVWGMRSRHSVAGSAVAAALAMATFAGCGPSDVTGPSAPATSHPPADNSDESGGENEPDENEGGGAET